MQSIKPTVPFFTIPFPSLEEMTKEQLGFYYTWLNEMQQGNFLDIEGNLSYVFVYMYQVVTEKDYDEIIEQLLQIQNNYGEYSKINEYCNLWITECYMAKRQFKKALHFSTRDFNIIKKAGKTLRVEDVIDLYPPDYSKLTDFGRSKREEINKEIVKMYIEIESQKSINLIDICTKIQKGFDYYILREASPRKITHYEFDYDEFWSYIPDVAKIAEDRVRENLGLPKIGQGWLNETRLYYEIKKLFSAYNVAHHARLPFLGIQHLDIYIHELNIGLEYQGEQHSNPTDYFGGEDSFIKNKERDERKKNLCEQNGVNLIYVYPNYSYDNVLSEISGICLEKGVVLNINALEEKDRLEIQNKIDAQYLRNNANKPLSEYIAKAGARRTGKLE